MGRVRARPALVPRAAPRVARHPDARARGCRVRRACAGADDGEPHALRPAAGGARAGHPRGRQLDEARFLTRLREDDPTRGIGDALLDQRNIAGIGNVWKSEGCFDAAIDPWRTVARHLRRRGARDRARHSARGCRTRFHEAVTSAGSRSTIVPGGNAHAARPGSAHAARARTTARPTGVPSASAEASRAQGGRPRRAREYAPRASRRRSSTAWT